MHAATDDMDDPLGASVCRPVYSATDDMDEPLGSHRCRSMQSAQKRLSARPSRVATLRTRATRSGLLAEVTRADDVVVTVSGASTSTWFGTIMAWLFVA
jgi:hypothetical protein